MNDCPQELENARPERLTQTRPGSGRLSSATLGNRSRIRCALKGCGKAFTLVELLVVMAVVVLLTLCLLPALNKWKSQAQRIRCASHLKQIGLGFRIWAGDHNDLYPMAVSLTNGGTMEFVSSGLVFPHFQVLSNELNTPVILVCPSDYSRRPATNFVSGFSNTNTSYFLSLDANETQLQMFLSGDSNLEVDGKPVGPGLLNLWTNSTVAWTAARHVRQGNVALADGSVQQCSKPRTQQALAESGVATNRLAIP